MAAGFGLANEPANASSLPIIDTHIHLFDPNRPQGVPWPEKTNAVLYRPALPARYKKVTQGLGIVGAIEIECSPWLEDNQWVLDIAANNPILVGTVGHLEPGHPQFPGHLARFHRNPLFRGIRYGNLWGRDLGAELSKPAFIAGLKALAEARLVLDTANPDPALIASVIRVTDKVPNLRVVVDHLPQLNPPAETTPRRAYQANLRELGKRPQVYVKVSQVLRRVGGRVPHDLNYYRARLDEIWDTFGPDRLIYGSDWPNSDQWAAYPQILKIVREYFTAKGPQVMEKFFWKNSIAAYHWIKRDANQPSLS
jgi:L-fucono-1,5-lactonase